MKKVLVWGLTNNRAGTEAVIVNYASRIEDISFDFLCYEEPENHWEQLDRNGNRFFVIPSKIKDPLGYYRGISRFMKEHGREYDALWFNVNDAANVDPLKYAVKYGIPKRIVHMHNAHLVDAPLTRFFHRLNRGKLLDLATDFWACSDAAAAFLGHKGNTRIIPNVIDGQRMAFSPEKRAALRTQFGWDDAFVIGSVGRLAYQKHPEFLVELLPRLLERDPRVKLVFVGVGDLAQRLQELGESLRVADSVHLAGSQQDLQGYLSLFDVYAQPSRFEGLGISIVEAQFNGLPCVVSTDVPREVDITTAIEHRSTTDPAAWVDALLAGNRGDVELLPRAQLYDAGSSERSFDGLF